MFTYRLCANNWYSDTNGIQPLELNDQFDKKTAVDLRRPRGVLINPYYVLWTRDVDKDQSYVLKSLVFVHKPD